MSTSRTSSKKVVSLNEFKQKKSLLQEEKEFQTYLKTLRQDQLQIEANYLIKTLDEKGATDKSLHQIALLMEELATRVDGDKMSSDINEFAANIRNKFKIELTTDLLH